MISNNHAIQSDAPKRVRFHSTCKCRIYRMPTAEDVRNAWYSDDDYATFRAERRWIREVASTLDVSSLTKVEAMTGHSCLGLDYFLSQSRAKEMKRLRNAAYAVVLGTRDIEIIGGQPQFQEVSRRASKAAHIRAVEVQCALRSISSKNSSGDRLNRRRHTFAQTNQDSFARLGSSRST